MGSLTPRRWESGGILLTALRGNGPFWSSTTEAMCTCWLSLPAIPEDQGSLFGLAVTSVQERVRHIGHLAGLEGLSPHDCRHSAADRAAKNGATLQELLEFGGWTNAQTAMRYLKRQDSSNKHITL